jgi:hypothetical protein
MDPARFPLSAEQAPPYSMTDQIFNRELGKRQRTVSMVDRACCAASLSLRGALSGEAVCV